MITFIKQRKESYFFITFCVKPVGWSYKYLLYGGQASILTITEGVFSDISDHYTGCRHH